MFLSNDFNCLNVWNSEVYATHTFSIFIKFIHGVKQMTPYIEECTHEDKD